MKKRIAGKDRPLETDFSAPLAYYPQKNELLEGFMGALRVSEYIDIIHLHPALRQGRHTRML